MATPARILAFSGSSRRESLNRKFLAFAVAEARALGLLVTLVDLNDFALPLYNGDLEDAGGMPAAAVTLSGLIASHEGLLVASPEYNNMITPLLKNTIDWCTRGDTNPFAGRVAAVLSASPGPYGGVRSLVMAQALLLKLECQVVPAQCALIRASEAFDAEGNLKDAHGQKAARSLVAKLAKALAPAGS